MSSTPDFPASSDLVSQSVAADAVGAHATEGHGHGARGKHCQNCGTPLRGPFCHRCGQHDFDVNRSFWHTSLEALESFFHFDTKLFKNLITLLFRPGRLTAAFNAGKRAAQMPPFRLYVFVSLFFFLFASLDREQEKPPIFKSTGGVKPNAGFTINGEDVTAKEAWQALTDGTVEDPAVREQLQQIKDEVAAELAAAKAGPAATEEAEPRNVDRIRAAAEEIRDEQLKEHADQGPSGWGAALEAKGRRLATPEGQKAMVKGFIHALPKLILICVPFFALYTRFLFRKTGQVYLQHLVLALHFHTFIFLWLMFTNGWVDLLGFASAAAASWVAVIGKLWIIVYPVVMLHYVFGNGWFKTLFKSFALVLAYGLTLAIGFFVTAVIVLLAL